MSRLVDQTIFYQENPRVYGNCTQAAVATLLGLKLNDVPAFNLVGHDPYEFWTQFENFFLNQGYYIEIRPSNFTPSVMYLASGKASRGVRHTVVMVGDRMFHDPHPSREGLLTIEHRHFIMPIDPSHFSNVHKGVF